ncbi:HD domain-containing protein [Janthinobacterium fluminis]|uniref:HD domain-containing protein n=1 Tax=Janthinobacterium fluminis TaxID=2987524 RepID=A0ABT5JVW8_9BURK|nr:HD domain-containing protein [Janthinobacterium fluminis]MDC8756734.1 HD domain-containing protein [Janthinobacterium fluminis]
MESNKIFRQLNFLREIDRLKSVMRQSPLLDQSRKENSAEHSWHLALYAWILAEYAAKHVDAGRVVKMLLLHDIVEVDAGDTPIHGVLDGSQAARESLAADRIFGLLPPGQCEELQALWREFEAAESGDAQFAKALDRFQPLLINVFTEGGTWAESDVQYQQVLERYGPVIQRGAPALWEVARGWIECHFKGAASQWNS